MSAPRPRVDAVALCFFANGSALAAWLPRLPGLRDDLGLSDTAVGLVLLCAGLGGLVASGLAGAGWLAAVTVAVFEGFSADWGAIVVTDRFDASPGVAGTAFVAFTAAMFCGRLAGDHVIDRLGPVRVVRGGAGLGAAGLAWITVAPGPGWAVVGFFVVGLGAAPVFPLLDRAATELASTAAGAGLGIMSAGARIGFLAAPALIGVLADATRPTTALVLVVGPALAVLARARGPVRPAQRRPEAVGVPTPQVASGTG